MSSASAKRSRPAREEPQRRRLHHELSLVFCSPYCYGLSLTAIVDATR